MRSAYEQARAQVAVDTAIIAQRSAPLRAADAATQGFAKMTLSSAALALWRNKMRSALTVLGVFIGVAALIAMVAIGQGANEAVRSWGTRRRKGSATWIRRNGLRRWAEPRNRGRRGRRRRIRAGERRRIERHC